VSITATATVSVLMTDLVGSTAMADRVGPTAAEVLRLEHFGLLRGALERTGGARGQDPRRWADGRIPERSSIVDVRG